MIQLNKTQIVLSFICLAALRISIGAHFFDQGHQKIQTGGFDASGFLKSAKGSFSPLFHSMLPDHSGEIRLCFDPLQEGQNKINPEGTLKIWEEYKNYVVDRLIQVEKDLVKWREEAKVRLEKLDSSTEEHMVLDSQYRNAEKTILAIRRSRENGTANRIFAEYSDLLTGYLMANEEEINFYFLGEERLDGFARDYQMAKVDGASSEESERQQSMREAAQVNLLRKQIESIAADRKSALAGWLAVIDGFWEGYEFELLNMVPLEDDIKDELKLALPTDSKMMSFINNAIPYFDLTVGCLLILGLFTRFAAMGAGLFLLSVLMTQEAILGAGSTPLGILYLVEMLAAFTLAATCAGRYAGLDYFIHAAWRQVTKKTNNDSEKDSNG